MTKQTEAPPEVVAALAQLEQATSPTEIGLAYKTVTDWRRDSAPWTLGRAFFDMFGVALVILGLFALLQIAGEIEISEFWQGALFAVCVMQVIHGVQTWSSRRTPVTMSFVDRVDEAIDRWRHAVPAMRDFPK